jgi:hypothetical protein
MRKAIASLLCSYHRAEKQGLQPQHCDGFRGTAALWMLIFTSL